jgi:hypothetical protein
MSARNTFTFAQYRLRPATEEDLPLAAAWVSADPHHRDTTEPGFWIEQKLARDSYVLEDEEGPIFFFKLHQLSKTAVEMHVQFPPAIADNHQRYRVQRGLIDGFTWLELPLKQAQVKVIHFDSTHPPLRKFATDRLGFAIQNEVRLSKSLGV